MWCDVKKRRGVDKTIGPRALSKANSSVIYLLEPLKGILFTYEKGDASLNTYLDG
jgi:hypothetical protein